MSEVDIYIVVEGQTEQTFVREILAPEMGAKGIYLYPVLIGRPGHKGGDIRFDRARQDIGNLLRQRTDTFITTMFDYYGIDSEWPGKIDVKQRIEKGNTLTAEQKAQILEAATHKEMIKIFPDCNTEYRFIPYFTMHDFEALLFSDLKILAEKLDVDMTCCKRIVENSMNPEEINDNPVKAPGKHLVSTW